MTYTEFHPAPTLRHLVERHFTLEIADGETVSELIIPDGTHGILFMVKNGFERMNIAGKGDTLANTSYFFGQKTQSVIYNLEQEGLCCFGAKLRPESISLLTGLPAAELTDRAVATSLISTDKFVELEEKIGEANSVESRIAHLENYLVKNVLPTHPKSSFVRHILDFIHRQRGQTDIRTLGAHFNMGYKRLERIFHQWVGVTPKTYCRIVRFNATMVCYRQRPQDNLTRLGYSSGYFDQMHFIKEIKHFTQLTPKAFFKNGLGTLGRQQRELVVERLKG